MAHADITTEQTKSKEFRFTGWHMFGIICLFFGTIITVNITMATFAVTNWTGLVVKNSYVASRDFNARLERARNQAALGWSTSIDLDGRSLTYRLDDAAGKAVAISSAEILIARHVGEDEMVRLTSTALASDGAVVFALPAPLGEGRWQITVEADVGADQPYAQMIDAFVTNGRFEK